MKKRRIFGDAKRELEKCVEELFEKLQQRGVSGMHIGVKVEFGDDEFLSFEIQKEVSEDVLTNKQPHSIPIP